MQSDGSVNTQTNSSITTGTSDQSMRGLVTNVEGNISSNSTSSASGTTTDLANTNWYAGTTSAVGQSAASQNCNESLKHSHREKAAFHGLKSAYRLVSSGSKGVDDPQPDGAARIAGEVGAAFLRSEGLDYDRDRSEQHLVEKVIDTVLGGGAVDELEAGIEKAWKKVDNGNHTGGARVAIAAAEEYLGEEVW